MFGKGLSTAGYSFLTIGMLLEGAAQGQSRRICPSPALYRPAYYVGGYGGYYAPIYAGSPATSIVNAGGSATQGTAYGSGAEPRGSRPDYYTEDFSGEPSAMGVNNNTALIRIRLPARAELWFDKTKMTQSGAVRQVVTPALDPERVYSYQVRARWVDDDGITVEKSLKVRAFAGTRVTINFVRPPQTVVAQQAPVLAVQPSGEPPLAPPEPSPNQWTAPSP